MRALFSGTLCLAMIFAFAFFGAMAEPAEVFEFPGGITWESTPDELEAILGEGCVREDHANEGLSMARIVLDDARYFGFDCGKAAFVYINDAFYAIACFYAEGEIGDMRQFADNLCALYGEAEELGEDRFSLEGFISSQLNDGRELYRWQLADETRISVWDNGEDAPYRYMAAFTNASAERTLAELDGDAQSVP